MSEPATLRSSGPVSSLCVFSWSMIQAAAIALAAFRVPLWAHAPAAGEVLAIPILFTSQMLGSSLLFPSQLSNWRSALITIITTWPFCVLAGLLGINGGVTIVVAAGYVTGWLLVLWAWRAVLSSEQSAYVGSAIAALWTAGGPILLFIGIEYCLDETLSPTQAHMAVLGPLSNGLEAIQLSRSNLSHAWLWCCTPIGTALVLAAIAGCLKKGVGRLRHRR